MASVIVTGHGEIRAWSGKHWEITDGCHTFYVLPQNMKVPSPKPGQKGVITFEYNWDSRSTRVTGFRTMDDPMVSGRPIAVGLRRHA